MEDKKVKTFRIVTLGCKVNQYESEAMEELFLERGYKKAGENEGSDVVVINTCSVTNASDGKSRQMINKAKKSNNEAKIAVCGCYPQVAKERVENIEGVDLILGTKDRDRIVDLIEETEKKGKIVDVSPYEKDDSFEDLEISRRSDHTRAYMKIQDGCNRFCSYCIIPYARGRIRSRGMESIIREAENLAKNYKEIVLTGIHIASYGLDEEGDLRLIDVIERINRIDGIERIRLSSIEPNIITEDFCKRLKKVDKICDHFHLSLQSGDDKVLRDMRRRYDRKVYREKIDLLRESFPDASFTTDIIVGFPGETEGEFQNTLEFVEEIGFAKIHVFPYSIRKGTPASERKDQIDGKIKKRRAKVLSELAYKESLKFNQTRLGKTESVLFEEEDGAYTAGYSKNYRRVYVKQDPSLHGKIKDVKIRDCDKDHLLGIII